LFPVFIYLFFQLKCDSRIAALKAKSHTLNKYITSSLVKKAASIEFDLESTRFCGRPCVVVDMDAFYASVEIRDNPALASGKLRYGG